MARWIADPTGGAWTAFAQSPTYRSVCLAVGPEGGFTESEVNYGIARGWGKLTLGPSKLRIETACVAGAALILASQKEALE